MTRRNQGFAPLGATLAEFREQLEREREIPTAALTTGPRDVCPQCKGAGYMIRDGVVYHGTMAGVRSEQDDGELISCPICKQPEQERASEAEMRQWSDWSTISRKRFETFDFTVPGVGKAYTLARAFARQPQGWLLLVGPRGAKEHLAAAVANEVADRGIHTVYVTMSGFLEQLRDAAFGKKDDRARSYDKWMEAACQSDFLVIEGVDETRSTSRKKKPTCWEKARIYLIINYRYNRQLPTVVTVTDLNRLGPRVFSRLTDKSLLFDGHAVRVEGVIYEESPTTLPGPRRRVPLLLRQGR